MCLGFHKMGSIKVYSSIEFLSKPINLKKVDEFMERIIPSIILVISNEIYANSPSIIMSLSLLGLPFKECEIRLPFGNEKDAIYSVEKQGCSARPCSG